MKICKYCGSTYNNENKYYCNKRCHGLDSRKEVLAKADNQTNDMYDVVIKNVLPVAKNMEQYRLWCKRATMRIMGDDKNPHCL